MDLYHSVSNVYKSWNIKPIYLVCVKRVFGTFFTCMDLKNMIKMFLALVGGVSEEFRCFAHVQTRRRYDIESSHAFRLTTIHNFLENAQIKLTICWSLKITFENPLKKFTYQQLFSYLVSKTQPIDSHKTIRRQPS